MAQLFRNDLTCDFVRAQFIYDPETGILRHKYYKSGRAVSGQPVGFLDSTGHIQTEISGKVYGVHRLIWLHYYGEWPKEVIDHINGDPSDNRIVNLREATCAQNRWNSKMPHNNTTGVKGVSWHLHQQKYVAYITKNGKRRWLGYYNTVAEAAEARNKADSLHGEFAYQ